MGEPRFTGDLKAWDFASMFALIAPPMSILKGLSRHPFPVRAEFARVFAASFAFPEEVLRPLVPPALQVDTYNGLGFVAVALVWTRNLRPAGFPGFLGQDFLLTGYRVFTRFRDDSGRSLRGLNILRSETDKRRMVWAGNLLTRYHYRHVKARVERAGTTTRITTSLDNGSPTLDIQFETRTDGVELPEGSPFKEWRTARRFAGPMPFTFSADGDEMVIIEGSRQNWVPRPVAVKHWQVGLFDEPALRGARPVLANAFTTENIVYRWEKGRVVRVARLA
jgi:uncharacterized protein YqjF (DUF2071 family)